MQRQVVLAVRVAAVDRVQPFRSPLIALPLLRPFRIRSEADVIRAKRLAVSKERELSRGFLDQHLVRLRLALSAVAMSRQTVATTYGSSQEDT